MFNKIPPNSVWLSAQIFSILSFVIILPSLVSAGPANTTCEGNLSGAKTIGCKIPPTVGSIVQVTIYDDSCRSVTNNSGVSRFIPTRYAAGWNSFVAAVASKSMVIDTCAACTSGVCCNIPLGEFQPAGTVCRVSAGVCDATETCTGASENCPGSDAKCSAGQYWNGANCVAGPCSAWSNPANGACSRTATNCDGMVNTCSGGTAYQYGANNQVWWSSAWSTPSTSQFCGTKTYSCSGNDIIETYYGCTTGGACTVTNTRTHATCGGGENSRCVAGQSTCQNLCTVGGASDDGDAYNDAQDADCTYGGCSQCTSGDCCNTANGCYTAVNTVIGTCGKCTGSSNTSVNQTSSEDLGGQCTTGSNGSATSCQSGNCSGSSRACGYLTNASTCRTSAAICDAAEKCTGSAFTCPSDSKCSASQYWNGTVCTAGNCATSGSCGSPVGNTADGSCNPYYTTQVCSGSANTCTGTTTNQYCYGSSGQVWYTSAYRTATATYRCNPSPTANSCSGQQPQGNAFACNGGGTCNVDTNIKVNVGSACAGNESSMCEGGACVNKCSNLNGGLFAGNDDGDGYVADVLDPDCGAQCSSGVCCNTSTGQYYNSSTVCRASAGICDATEYCTGSSDACPTTDAKCPANQYWNGSACVSGACSTSAGICDATDYCTGSSNVCTDAKCSSGYYWNGTACTSGPCSAWSNPANGACSRTATNCSGAANTCSGGTAYQYGANSQVWWSSTWTAGTTTYRCNPSPTANYCSGQQPQGDSLACTTAGACTVDTGQVNVGSPCAGTENSMCVNGVCTDMCSNTVDNDGDGYNDAGDPNCGGCGQCTPGTCCTASACYATVGTSCGTNSYCNSTGGCIACNAGNYWDGDSCEVCPAGKYCTGGTNITDCACGTYRSTTGGTSQASCSNCTAGYYCNAGSTSATQNDCPAGYYCVAGSCATGTPCPAGKYRSSIRGTSSASCSNCSCGKYSTSTGRTSDCTLNCTAGYYCNAGSTSATQNQCPANYYCTAGSCATGTSCGGGYTSPAGSDASNDCVVASCSAGYYLNGGSCTICPAGQYCTGGTNPPTNCNCGTYRSTTGGTSQASCSNCTAGYYCAPGSTSATAAPCPAGKYCTAGSCAVDCPAGTTFPGQYATSLANCSPCPCGTYGNVVGETRGGCVGVCPEGYYCPAGTLTANENICPAGHYCSTCSCSPTQCNCGTYRSTTGGTSQSDCSSCTAGYYCNAGSTSATQNVCPAGYYCVAGSCATGTPCPAGKYRSTTGGTSSASCSNCAAGYYGSQTGLTVSTCTGCCESGFYCPAGSTSPTQNRCPNNTESAPYATSVSSCTACPAGTFWVDHQLTRVGEIIDRMQCYTGYNLCETCPAGSYCTGGVRYSCPAGTYRSATGGTSSGSCTTCPAGYYCPGSETYYDYSYQY